MRLIFREADFQMRIGINTGQVIAGKVGNDLHMDYTVIGETVNLAYHLELVAEPGTILVSPETYQRTRSLFEFKALPPLTIDWLPQPIQAFHPLYLQQTSGLESGVSGTQAPLIGQVTKRHVRGSSRRPKPGGAGDRRSRCWQEQAPGMEWQIQGDSPPPYLTRIAQPPFCYYPTRPVG
jgi:hypothetical protein